MNTLQAYDKHERATVATLIPGESENSSEGGEARNSAIPSHLDGWFHGDFRTDRPLDLDDALGTKDLAEYDDQLWPNYRLETVVDIGMNTDGEEVQEAEINITFDNDGNQLTTASAVTLEGESGETNPFRQSPLDSIDNGKQYMAATDHGPHTNRDRQLEPIGDQNIEGVRGSVIFGANDPYVVAMKDISSIQHLIMGNIPAALMTFVAEVPAFYVFLDFIFMADGTKVVRVWDASVYPAHALYVGGTRQDRTPFRQGVDWTLDGPPSDNTAFHQFVTDSIIPGRTPFDTGGAFGYKQWFTAGAGNHPPMDYTDPGSSLSIDEVTDAFPDPAFPI